MGQRRIWHIIPNSIRAQQGALHLHEYSRACSIDSNSKSLRSISKIYVVISCTHASISHTRFSSVYPYKSRSSSRSKFDFSRFSNTQCLMLTSRCVVIVETKSTDPLWKDFDAKQFYIIFVLLRLCLDSAAPHVMTSSTLSKVHKMKSVHCIY